MTADIIWASVSGIFLVGLGLGLAVWIVNPTPTQMFFFRTSMALAGGSMAAAIPGVLQVQVEAPGMGVRAGAGLGVFVLIYLVNPGQLTHRKQVRLTDELLREFGEYSTGPVGEITLRVKIAEVFVKGLDSRELMAPNSGVPWSQSKYKKYVQRTQIVNATLHQFHHFLIDKCNEYRQAVDIAVSQAQFLESLRRRLQKDTDMLTNTENSDG